MKGRIFLFHWKETEIETLAAPLREAGWQVETEAEDGARGIKAIIENPPDVVVFCLTRLPSHGRRTAEYLKERKSTRHIPIVFVDGKEDAIEKTRERIPDGIYTTSARLTARLNNLITSGSNGKQTEF